MSLSQFLSSSFSLSTTATFLSPTSINKSFTTKLLPPIRMGGGPRTFPGGVNKWQWKRMQAKKSKQLLKARLLRERQIYEMRKRAELKASIAELEKPWELVEKAPVLFSIKADEQVKALADRFQKPGGFDMWSHSDGPQMLDRSSNCGTFSDSRRFFPKGVVHSVKPYGVDNDDDDDVNVMNFNDWISRGGGGVRRRNRKEDVRLKADEKEGCIDVEGTVVSTYMDDNQRMSRNMNHRNQKNSHLGYGNSKNLMHRNGHSGQEKSYSSDSDIVFAKKYKNMEGVITLRPTSDLHVTEGRNRWENVTEGSIKRKSYNWKDD